MSAGWIEPKLADCGPGYDAAAADTAGVANATCYLLPATTTTNSSDSGMYPGEENNGLRELQRLRISSVTDRYALYILLNNRS